MTNDEDGGSNDRDVVTENKEKEEEEATCCFPPDPNPPPAANDNRPRRIVRRRRVVGTAQAASYQVDAELLEQVLAASNLPVAVYQFEVLKTVQRCVAVKATHVALQLPEGLLLYATVLADVLLRLVPNLRQISILADVTYGACCVDDLTAAALSCQLLIHYGHSCLVPLQHTVLPVLYVFVDIQIHVQHLVECLVATLQARPPPQPPQQPHIYLLGTVQFRHCLVTVQDLLKERGYSAVSIPQCKPLSAGEVLGCTSPVLNRHDAEKATAIVCFVADGRFHLESTMISNASAIDTFYRYDPYSKTLTIEAYDHDQMKRLRQSAIARAAGHGTAAATTFGIILGTLGRQGNPAIVQRLQRALRKAGKRHFLVLLSEITPAKLRLLSASFSSKDSNNCSLCWVQVACPRLSVDWGHALSPDNRHPVLSPYELFVCLGETDWQESYPMDYYSAAGGPWTNYYETNRDRQLQRDDEDTTTPKTANEESSTTESRSKLTSVDIIL